MAAKHKTWIRYVALLLSVALLVAGNGLQQTLIGLRAGIEGYSGETVGVMMSAYFIGFVIASIYAPWVIQRVGHIRAFAAFASAGSVFALCFVLFVSAPVWIALRVMQGACYAGLVIVVESWLNASAEAKWRGRVLAIYSVVMYAAWAISQPIIALADPSGFVLFAVVSIFLSLALMPITLSNAGGPGVVVATRVGIGQMVAISPVALAGAFTMGAVVGAFFSMWPSVSHALGDSTAATGFTLSATLIGALVCQWPLGWLSDRIDRRLIILAGSLAGITVTLLFLGALADRHDLPVSALAFILGGALMPLYSICLAEVNDRIDNSEMIAVASGFVLVYGVGQRWDHSLQAWLLGRSGPLDCSSLWQAGWACSLHSTFYMSGSRPRPKTTTSKAMWPRLARATRCCPSTTVVQTCPTARRHRHEADPLPGKVYLGPIS